MKVSSIEKKHNNLIKISALSKSLKIRNPFFRKNFHSLKEEPEQYQSSINMSMLASKNKDSQTKFDKICSLFDVFEPGYEFENVDPNHLCLKVYLDHKTERSAFSSRSDIRGTSKPDSVLLDYEELKNLKKRVSLLRQLNPNLQIIVQEGKYSDEPIFYDIDIYIICNDFIYGIVKKIESTKIDGEPLSQFEKFLAAQHYVKQFQYILEDQKANESWRLSRTLPGIFASGNICCVGYAFMMLEILDKLKIPSLHVNAGDLNKCKTRTNHSLISVKLDDEKYKIHGIYYADITDARIVPIFTLLTYKEIQREYRKYNSELKTINSLTVPAEEPAFFFEDNKDIKQHVADEIIKYQDFNLYDLLHLVLDSDYLNSRVDNLTKNKQAILKTLKRGLLESAQFGAMNLVVSALLSKDKRKLPTPKEEDITPLVQQDIAILLDQCLGKTPEEIEKMDFPASNASSLVEQGHKPEKLHKLYVREFNRVLPTSFFKKRRPLSNTKTFDYIIDNMGETVFYPSISMSIKKLRDEDLLFGKHLYGRFLVEQTLPINKNLIKETEQTIGQILDSPRTQKEHDKM